MGGEEGLAKRRVKKCMDLLRAKDGTWEKFFTTFNDRSVQVYAGWDKNGKQVATEQVGKKIAGIIRSKVGHNNTIHFMRIDGIVTFNGQDLVKIEPTSRKEYSVKWNNAILEKSGLSKQSVVDEVELALGSSAGGTEWCL